VETIRERPVDNFTQIINDVLRDERISDMARGVLCKMLSYPDGWTTTADKMWKDAAKYRPWDRNGAGRRAYRAVFAELERAGYLQRERRHQADGRFKTVLILRNTPANWDSTAHVTDCDENQATGVPEPAPRDRGTGNGRSETGTSIRNTEDLNTKSGSDELASRRARAASQRRRDQATIIEEVRDAIGVYYSWDESDALADWQVWELWEGVRGDRPDSKVTNIPRYLSKPFTDAPNLDSLLANYVEPG